MQIAIIGRGVVGRAMRQMPGMSSKILSTLGDQQINIRTINQACDEQSIVIGGQQPGPGVGNQGDLSAVY
ncbi:hypothetical protein FD23_GL000089 [Lactobacillus delbrueckii subsp. delbrueckii DSM 20074 = JCM 1012]|uniref:ACT domain-containing protein n=1 Tax=Lactobacillus delbrueckii TaxID=1584 RepID=UPI000470F5EA|nr:ACT domain-containing protein [Lactobacillus delbrueckii]KNZ37895.1 hypothetical protein LDD39_05400 [Lactobacillus delbrueckii subsp. delbrueckii]KRK27644.1 hypothetical protein FD23_GL000089 [Lactobacillus delbrueckii subsp. delbrueckii DSM 20074 = JCM 1012]